MNILLNVGDEFVAQDQHGYELRFTVTSTDSHSTPPMHRLTQYLEPQFKERLPRGHHYVQLFIHEYRHTVWFLQVKSHLTAVSSEWSRRKFTIRKTTITSARK